MPRQHRVVWSKGMFLTPQHFQAQDNAFADALQFRFASSLFANWGVVSLSIDPEKLTNGLFEVARGTGLFSDGLPFSFPDFDKAPAARALADYFGADQESLDVYLAVPLQRKESNFVREQAGSASHRYVVKTANIADESGVGDERALELAQPNLQILFAPQSRDGFVSFQIARVVKNQASLFILDPEFVPPCVDIAASSYLMMLLRRQVEVLASKSDSLNSGRKQRGQNLADFNTTETAKFWLLHTVNSALPELKHFWAVRRGHPEILYRMLLRLAGALSTFALDPKMRELPEYNHERLGGCFGILDERIRDLLETVIPSKCMSIPLRRVDKAIWTGQITNEEQLRETQFVLAISATMGEDDLIKKAQTLVKMASADDLQDLLNHFLPGVTLRHTATPPPAVPFRLNEKYFTLNQSGRLWDKIVKSRTVSLFVPADLPEAKVELMVVAK